MSWVMHAVQIGSTELIGCQEVAVDPGDEILSTSSDGGVDRSAVFHESSGGRIRVVSHAVGSVLSAVGILTGTDGAFRAWDVAQNADGTKAAGGHVRSEMANARTFVRGVSAGLMGPATIAFEAIGYNASGNAVLTTATGASDAPAVSANSEVYRLGGVSVNGNGIAGAQSVQIDPGLQEYVEYKDGTIAVCKVHVGSRGPVIRVTTLDPSMQQYTRGGSGPYSGIRAIGSTVTVRLARRAPDGTFSSSSNNVLFTFAAGVVRSLGVDAARRSHVFEVVPRVGSEAIIQVNTAAA